MKQKILLAMGCILMASSVWATDYTLTLYADGCSSPNTFICFLDQQLSVSATSMEHRHFVMWNDGNTDNPRLVTMNQNYTFTATFADDFTVQLTCENGRISGGKSYYKPSDTVVLNAEPYFGYSFVQWSDGVTDNPRTIVVTQDSSFTAEMALDYEGVCGDNLIWKYNKGVLTISGTDDMYGFSSSSVPWINFRDSITKVVLPDGLTKIGNYAFYNCKGFSSIVIPNSVTNIGYDAFSGCSGLASITIPNSVTSISSNVFSGCTSLKSVVWNAKNCQLPANSSSAPFYNNRGNIESFVFGDEVQSIPSYLCYGMSKLTSVIIPNSVTSVEFAAFGSCSGLTSITIPNSVMSIGLEAFVNCSGLTSITIPNSVTSLGDKAFYGCSGLTSITIPNSVTSLGDQTFFGCSGLTSVTIGNSVTGISSNVFSGCTSLKSVVWNAKNCQSPANSSSAPFYNNRGNIESFVFGDEVQSISSCLCYGMSKLTSVIIPNSVTSIEFAAFGYCSGLTSITIPNSVTSIGDRAFRNCSGLTSMTIGNSVMSIGSMAFYNCSGLTSFTIPNSVTSLGDQTFYNCSGLTSITIPNSVTSISSNAFSGCTGITSVVWNARNCQSPSSYNDAPFYSIRTNIASFNFGDEVSKIPAYLCYGMSNLSDVIIPNSVSSIGDKAFYGCKRLVKVTCFANTPPTAQATSFQYYDCDLFVPCDELRTYKRDEVFGQFENIQCIGAEQGSVVTNVVVTPSENSANIVWPKDDTADTYTIVITKDGTTICTLTFNSNGQLMNIAFAPSRDGESPARVAESINGSWSFTVTSLDPATTYAYTVTTKNAAQSVLNTYTGNFTTTGTTGIETVNTGVDTPTKFLRDGQILIQRNNTTYNLRGQVVK